MVADRSLSTRCGMDGVPIATTIARALATIGMSAVFFQDSIGLVTFDHEFTQLQGLRPRIGKGQVIHCLDAYQYGDGPAGAAHTSATSARRCSGLHAQDLDGAGHLRLPVRRRRRAGAASWRTSTRCTTCSSAIVDASFAFELPGVSAGWIEAFDVESGRSRVMSRRELMAHGRPRARLAGRRGADGEEGGARRAAARGRIRRSSTSRCSNGWRSGGCGGGKRSRCARCDRCDWMRCAVPGCVFGEVCRRLQRRCDDDVRRIVVAALFAAATLPAGSRRSRGRRTSRSSR